MLSLKKLIKEAVYDIQLISSIVTSGVESDAAAPSVGVVLLLLVYWPPVHVCVYESPLSPCLCQ